MAYFELLGKGEKMNVSKTVLFLISKLVHFLIIILVLAFLAVAVIDSNPDHVESHHYNDCTTCHPHEATPEPTQTANPTGTVFPAPTATFEPYPPIESTLPAYPPPEQHPETDSMGYLPIIKQ
jgi:hypothetical protein